MGLLPLETYTTGEHIFESILHFFTANIIELKKLCLLVTDGAPSMLGKNKGLKARLAEVAPNMIAIHCIIHRGILCARLDGHLKQIMQQVVKIIHFIKCNFFNYEYYQE